MTHTTQPVAVTMRDGPVVIIRIITSAPAEAFDPMSALVRGYSVKVGEDRTSWHWEIDEVTDDFVEREIANMPSLVGVVGWRFVSEADIPKERENRNALVDTGEALVYR